MDKFDEADEWIRRRNDRCVVDVEMQRKVWIRDDAKVTDTIGRFKNIAMKVQGYIVALLLVSKEHIFSFRWINRVCFETASCRLYPKSKIGFLSLYQIQSWKRIYMAECHQHTDEMKLMIYL